MNLGVISDFIFKEAITSLEVATIDDSDRCDLVLSTIEGDVRILKLESGKKMKLTQVVKASGLPPIVTLAIGSVLGGNIPDLVVGGLDNTIRVISLSDGSLAVKDTTQLGTLPTAVCVTNVVGDEASEIVVATNDRALRCYGWFDACLDKLAHKVVDRPVFSMQPLRSKDLPYSRLVFGDDSGHLYVYQYADDRLHEISRMGLGGDVHLVATGSVTGGRNDNIITVSDGINLNLLAIGQNGLEVRATMKASSPITSVRIGRLHRDSKQAHIMVGLGDSTVMLLSYDGHQLTQEASIKTKKKSVESLAAFGDVNGDGEAEIVQAVGNTISLITATE